MGKANSLSSDETVSNDSQTQFISSDDNEEYGGELESDSSGEDYSRSEGGEIESDSSGEEEDVGGGGEEKDEDEDVGGVGGGVEESDSSEDEITPRNTIGEVPLEWYKDEDHIGYDIAGKKIKKKDRQDKLDSFLANVDDSNNWRKIYDEYNDEEVELTKKETKIIRRLLKGKAPHGDFDPYAPYVDWFKWDDAKHPLSNAPEPKRRFIPSKWESKKVVQYVRAIRKGLIKFDKPKEEPRFYPLWDDSSSNDKTNYLAYVPAPKPKLPGHDESYNPPIEYIPTQEEINSYQLMYEEDRPKFIPKRFTSLRSIPAYDNAIRDSFDRCLDLYLCPRVRKKRLNIDPESLKPNLPSKKDLRPYPTTCYLEYKGHKGAVVSISIDVSGQWIASGSMDGTVRIWEVETGRSLRIFQIGEAVQFVTWNPRPELPIIAVAAGHDVHVLNTGLGNEEQQRNIKELLHIETPSHPDESDKEQNLSWIQDDKNKGIRLEHFKTVSTVEWHFKGDYFSASMPAEWKFIKKLETGLREISSVAIHPGGDNLIVGSKEGKLCWFDMDLSSKPYKTLKCHPKDITNVAFHRSYPLFASCSDDCTAYIFHGMVYSDLNQNPLIVPLEILRGHASAKGRGVMDCKFHPRQPWLFTAGADSVIKLYCH